MRQSNPIIETFNQQVKLLSTELATYTESIEKKVKIEQLHLDSNKKEYKQELRDAYTLMLDQKKKLLKRARTIGFNYSKFRKHRAEQQSSQTAHLEGSLDISQWSLELALRKVINFYKTNPQAYYAGLQAKRNDGYFAFLDIEEPTPEHRVPSDTSPEVHKRLPEESLIFPTKDRAPFGVFMNRTFTKNDVFYLAYNSVGLEGSCTGNSHRKVVCDLPYLALSMESNYEPPDGRRLMELNFDFISEDNTFGNRYLSFEIDNDTYFTRWGLAGNDIRMEQSMNSQNFVFQPSGNARFFFKNKEHAPDIVQLGGYDDHHRLSAIEIGPSALTRKAEVHIKNNNTLKKNQTPLSVYISGIGHRDIYVGKPDSCGSGYRCLRIPN